MITLMHVLFVFFVDFGHFTCRYHTSNAFMEVLVILLANIIYIGGFCYEG